MHGCSTCTRFFCEECIEKSDGPFVCPSCHIHQGKKSRNTKPYVGLLIGLYFSICSELFG
jgi:hypothetical protein